MVAPATGAVVLVHFPFSDLSQTKLRPALVLAEAGQGDWILCQVTSKSYGDTSAIKLDDASFATGSLVVDPADTSTPTSGGILVEIASGNRSLGVNRFRYLRSLRLHGSR